MAILNVPAYFAASSWMRRRSARMLRMAATLMAIMGAVLSVSIVPASASSTTDYTCQGRAEHISTCEWMVLSVVKKYGQTDTQIVMYAEMKGGTANREIIDMHLYYRQCPYKVCGIFVAAESRIPVIGGTYTVSWHIGPVMCNWPEYRPVFTYKIYEGKSAGWVYGTSNGNWKNGGISPCNSE